METNTESPPPFGGFKLITARPMDSGEASVSGYRVGDPEDGIVDGYEVTYEDGYKSWSPTEVFEKAYDSMFNDGQVASVHLDLLRFFSFDHLPAHLQAVSAPFCAMAWRIARRSKDPREATVAIRKLLEAKDAAVRAAL